jgi:hypothetical protein
MIVAVQMEIHNLEFQVQLQTALASLNKSGGPSHNLAIRRLAVTSDYGRQEQCEEKGLAAVHLCFTRTPTRLLSAPQYSYRLLNVHSDIINNVIIVRN